MRRLGFLLSLLLSVAGCRTGGSTYVLPGYEEVFSFPLARLTNLSDPACGESLSAQVTSVLVKEGETEDVSQAMAIHIVQDVGRQTEPGPFYALSPAGQQYGFVLQETEYGCVLRLYQSHRVVHGTADFNYTNTEKFIANRTLLYCSCKVEFPGEH